MFGKETLEQIAEDSAATVLDDVKDVVDATDFEAIVDRVLNKLEGAFNEGGLPDRIAETVAGRIRERFNIEDTDPDN